MKRPVVSALQWRIEEACLNAWPALREVLLDGWLLRFSEGLTRRANSANALAPVGSPALTKCQCLYRRLGLPTIFRVLSFADPAIDQQLAKADYTSEGASCVLYVWDPNPGSPAQGAQSWLHQEPTNSPKRSANATTYGARGTPRCRSWSTAISNARTAAPRSQLWLG